MSGLIDANCDESCEAMPDCPTCGFPKKPRGRSGPLEMRLCDSDCPGYYNEPKAGHLWPGELKEVRG